MNEVKLGLDTFGDITVNEDGERQSDAQTIRDIVDEAVLADQVGLAFFGVGSPATTRCACTSASRRSTRSHAGAPR
jgi:hypothetical protein